MSSQHTNDIPFNSIFTKVNSDGSLTSLGQSYLNLGNKVLLSDALDAAEALLSTAAAGEEPGNYPEEAITAFQSAYEAAGEKKDSTSEAELKKAYEDLSKATKTFEEARIKVFTKNTSSLTEADFAASLTKGLKSSSLKSSSSMGANTALMAFDGKFGTRWESEHGDNQWLAIDFGEEVEFNAISFKWEAAYSLSYSLEISENGTDWTSILDVSDGSGNFETYKFTVMQKTRYLRFYGKTRATGYGHSFYEMGVFNE